jgi:hypothetical protein
MTDQTALQQHSTTATNDAVAEMWRDLLRLTTIDPNGNFFELGGTSLTAIKFLQRVEKTFGPDVLSPDTLYGDPRLASVAGAIDRAVGGG